MVFDIVRVVTYRNRLFYNIFDSNTIHAKFIRNISPVLQNVFAQARSGTVRTFVVINDRISVITSRGHIEMFCSQTMNKIYHIVLRAQHRAATLSMINDNIIFGSIHGEIYSSNLFAHKPTPRDCCGGAGHFTTLIRLKMSKQGVLSVDCVFTTYPMPICMPLLIPAEEPPAANPNDVEVIDE